MLALRSFSSLSRVPISRFPLSNILCASYATTAPTSAKTSTQGSRFKTSKTIAPKSGKTTAPKDLARLLKESKKGKKAVVKATASKEDATKKKVAPPAPIKKTPSDNTTTAVEFKRKKKKRILTHTMAMAAKAYARQQRRVRGDKTVGKATAREEVLAEFYEQAEGHTIHVTKEEFDADPSTLTFEQLYRRILRSFEDDILPSKQLLFEMLKKAKADEEWNNFVIIAKVYQSKLLMLKPRSASFLVNLAVNNGFATKLFDEMQKNIWFVYPSKAGYQKLIEALAASGGLDKVWKLLQLMAERDMQPARKTFHFLIQHYHSTDLDTALKFFKTSSGLGVRTSTTDTYTLARKLAEQERWNDILEVEKIAKKDNPASSSRNLLSLIFINAHIKGNDVDGASELVKANSFLKEDIASLQEVDKQAFPFIESLVGTTIPKLSATA